MSVTLYLSGGASNSDTEASLGGAISATEAAANLLGTVSDAEFTAGTTLYRLVYVKATADLSDLKLWIATETPSSLTTVYLGWAAAGKNQTEAAVANERTAPAGVTFSSPRDQDAATSGGDFDTGDYRGLWIKYAIQPTSSPGDEQFGLSYGSSSGPPVNLTIPTISGTFATGETLTASPGTWSRHPTSYAYQWQLSTDGTTAWATIGTGTTYALSDVEAMKFIRVRVIASNDNGDSDPANSQASTEIWALAPVSIVAPVITGTPAVGARLNASSGTWTGAPTGYYYVWSASVAQATWTIVGSGSSYILPSSLFGQYIKVSVTAYNSATSSEARDSAVVGPVGSAVPINTVSPAISGTVVYGATLTASSGTWTNTPLSYAYQWQVSTDGETWSDLGTGSTYEITIDEVGKYLRVLVIATNASGASLEAYSSVTEMVPGSLLDGSSMFLVDSPIVVET